MLCILVKVTGSIWNFLKQQIYTIFSSVFWTNPCKMLWLKFNKTLMKNTYYHYYDYYCFLSKDNDEGKQVYIKHICQMLNII